MRRAGRVLPTAGLRLALHAFTVLRPRARTRGARGAQAICRKKEDRAVDETTEAPLCRSRPVSGYSRRLVPNATVRAQFKKRSARPSNTGLGANKKNIRAF